MSDLKPCPFCGEDRASICVQPDGVHCNACEVFVEWPNNRHDTISAWNDRPIEDALVQEYDTRNP